MSVQYHAGVLQLLNFKTVIWKAEGVHYTSCGMICQIVYRTSSHNLDMLAVKFINLTPVLVGQGFFNVLVFYFDISTFK
jgi:hypothetical protein